MEHVHTLPKTDGLVPIWISADTGQFRQGTITLGARGDSYYEYLLKQWLQVGRSPTARGSALCCGLSLGDVRVRPCVIVCVCVWVWVSVNQGTCVGCMLFICRQRPGKRECGI